MQHFSMCWHKKTVIRFVADNGTINNKKLSYEKELLVIIQDTVN